MLGNDQFKHTNPITRVQWILQASQPRRSGAGDYGITTGRKPSRGKAPMGPVTESGCGRKR
jgi:hypothetical protein